MITILFPKHIIISPLLLFSFPSLTIINHITNKTFLQVSPTLTKKTMMEEEISFPRGGHPTKSSSKESSTTNKDNNTTKSSEKKKKKSRKRSESNDFLFGTGRDDVISKKNSKKQKKNKEENANSSSTSASISTTTVSSLPIGGGAVQQPINSSSQKKPAFIESISFQKLTKGMKLLGIVREVAEEYAVVSLPSMLTGFIRRDSNGGIRLDHVVSVGMVLPVAVVKATSETVNEKSNGPKSKPVVKRRIELSVSPAAVNNGLSAEMLYEGMFIRGRIRSIEDHGCLIDLSISGIKASACFLKYENIEGGYEVLDTNDEEMESSETSDKFLLNCGRVYDFVVGTIPNKDNGTSNIIQLELKSKSSRSDIVTNPSECKKANHTIRSLCPGHMFRVDVEHFARNGLCVTFMGSVYRGAIDSNNLGGFLPEDYESPNDKNTSTTKDMWWKNVFIGKLRSINARLIAVDPVSKIMRFSLLPHILSLKSPEDACANVGEIIENARVIRLDHGVGALLALPSSYEQSSNGYQNPLKSNQIFEAASKISCAYVHISKAIDSNKNRTPEALFAKKFSPNTVIPKLRIISTSNWMDNIASCATADSIVSAAVLTHTDLCPGRIYRAVPVIANLENGAVLVQLGTGVKGLIPATHLFDKSLPNDGANTSYRNKIRMEKYKVGNKIDVRCLLISPSERKCVLTAKKSLISSDIDNPITEYANIEKDRIATGYISRVSKQGIAITFYNNVFGRISARKLAEEMGVEDPTVDYNVGDVVKVKVHRCFKKPAKEIDGDDDDVDDSFILDLSLNLLSDEEEASSKYGSSSELIGLIKPGMILKSKSMKIIELTPSKYLNNSSFLPGHAVVSVKSKYLCEESRKDDNKTGSITLKLPYEHILDTHNTEAIESPETMDALASKVLSVGKRIAQEAVVISITNRAGLISTPIVSLKPSLVATAKDNLAKDNFDSSDVILPTPSTALFMGAHVRGYCVRLHPNYGAFIRFLGGLTAIIPKLKGGLDVGLYDTVLCKIVAMDVMNGKAPKILLKQVQSITSNKQKDKKSKEKESSSINVADLIKPGSSLGNVKIDDINFARAAVTILDEKFSGVRVKARIHVTMAKPVKGNSFEMPIGTTKSDNDDKDFDENEKITKYHPFAAWKVGNTIKHVRCVAVDVRDGITYLELTNRDSSADSSPIFFDEPSRLTVGSIVTGIITSVAKQNKGLWVQICPGINGFIPGLELSDNIEVLNNLRRHFRVGGRVHCSVIDDKADKRQFREGVRLTLLDNTSKDPKKSRKPIRGDTVIGRINRFIKQQRAPSLMMELSGGYLGRCDITELEENDDWENMPLGRSSPEGETNGDELERHIDDTDENDEIEVSDPHLVGDFHHGRYVQCRVLASSSTSKGTVEVSLRQSRLDGDLENDEPPEDKEVVHAYVVATTKKGCFLRLSRFVEGRVILKELSDSFLPDPSSIFPPGRLVVGKVKAVKIISNSSNNKNGRKKVTVDLDMRESVLLEDQNKLVFDDIKEGEKHRGVVTRIESYGVFVRLENSEVSGLVHLSECSDDYVKNLASMYNPGDLVKVLVLRVEKEDRRIGLSMKPSHFDDDESDDDSDIDMDSSDDNEDDDEIMNDVDEADLDSDDENFVSKLATKTQSNEDTDDESDDASDSSDEDSDDDDSTQSSSEDSATIEPKGMDTDVGFDWGTNTTEDNKNNDNDSSDSSDSDSDSDDDNAGKRGHKSRKKALAKRQEEKEIAKMEQRIADGTADENPETTADFERLIASDPNSSENWIKFMAYHLSLADIESARTIANRAFERIEFREEGEKLNVWTALITLENKYGTPNSLNAVIERASQHNNPKKVYLRVCEMMERDVETSNGDIEAVVKADDMFAKMCKKFKSKKTVWIANFQYLLKNGRHEEAHKLWKRSIISLPSHKHIESMSKFAQIEYEYGSAERARTIFDSLLAKNPKRMDLIFVYVDKEIKHGDLAIARQIFENIVRPKSHGQKTVKFNDKQMKSLFKKWYRMEDEHGDDESRMHVKVAAKEYVEKNTK